MDGKHLEGNVEMLEDNEIEKVKKGTEESEPLTGTAGSDAGEPLMTKE